MKAGFILYLIFLTACSNKHRLKSPNIENISTAQKTLFNILDSFKTEYSSANSTGLKESVINKWQLRLHTFVRYSYIDSIDVHVDSVIVNGWKVTTQFHCGRDIEFRCGLTFKESMNQNEESQYRFMKGLRRGTDTIVNFNYINWPEINNPNNTSMPIFRIYAFPSPIK